MHCFLDTTALASYPSGIAIYTIELYRALFKICPGFQVTTGQNSLHAKGRGDFLSVARKYLSPEIKGDFRIFPGSIPLDQHPFLKFLFGIDNRKYDIVHIPGNYCSHSVPLKDFSNVVLTIHDVYAFRNSQNLFSQSHIHSNPALVKYLPIQAKKAAAIVTVSDFSKREITKYLGITPEKIRVIPNACQWDVSTANIRLCLTPKVAFKIAPHKFFLAVGTIYKHKNYKNLLHAWQRYRQSSNHQQEKLVIVGANRDDETYEMIQQAKDVVHFKTVAQNELLSLYQNALGFFAISFVEGFGIPLLEAMTCGCLACYSKGTSMDEIGREACFSIDPTNVDEIQGMFSIMRDLPLEERKRRIHLEKQIAQEYSWEKIAREYLKIFQSIADRKSR